MCHHRPCGFLSRHTHRLCERECCAICYRQYQNPPTRLYTTTYTAAAAAASLVISSSSSCPHHLSLSKHQHTQRQHASLFQSSARPYYSISVHIHTLTQPLLPDRADSAYFHRASIAVRLSHCRPVATPLPTLSKHMLALTQISTQAASRVHMAWAAHLSSSPSSSSKHHASLTSTRANDPLIICAAHRTLLQQSIH